MSWLGKILGGGLGFFIGGPIGAVLGAVIGHQALDADSGQGGGGFFSRLETKQSLYFTGVFSMLGKLAKADGVVSQHEIDMVERVMRDNLRLTPDARRFAIQVFNTAKNSSDSFEDYARQFHQEFRFQREVLTSIIDLLLVVAHADGAMHPTEERLIRQAAGIFGVEREYEQLQQRFGGSASEVDHCYEILGSKRGDDLASVKRRYRKLAMEHHPDRIQSKGMAPEFAAHAEERFKEIQHAWDVVEKDLQSRA
ncbi:MAG: co-chaperone DjlA [Pseudomonadales bacterium]|nr:co-chaperone DjlA [Pseudomonadales bacterium]